MESKNAYNSTILNLGNSIFPGWNEKNGLVICGYEWGNSKTDQAREASGVTEFRDFEAIATFSNKRPTHGPRALTWSYDNRVIRWFGLWGHPLKRDGLGSNFDKSIVQTNWCDTQGQSITEDYFVKLRQPDQIDNFINHVNSLEPAVLIFMGSSIIDILQTPEILVRFEAVVGASQAKPEKIQKEFSGRRFKVGFQSFEHCEVVSLPHPSSSRGLSDAYISLYRPELSGLIQRFKESKGIA